MKQEERVWNRVGCFWKWFIDQQIHSFKRFLSTLTWGDTPLWCFFKLDIFQVTLQNASLCVPYWWLENMYLVKSMRGLKCYLNVFFLFSTLTCTLSVLSPPGVWYVGVDSGGGYRVFSSVCSLLGDVCCHFVLGSDHLPVYNVPHWSPQQDTTGPLDYTGKTNTHISVFGFLFCIFTNLSDCLVSLSVDLQGAVLELQCYSSVGLSGDSLMARFHYSAEHGLRGLWRQRPVFGCVSTWLPQFFWGSHWRWRHGSAYTALL